MGRTSGDNFVFTYLVMGLFLLTGYSTGTAIISTSVRICHLVLFYIPVADLIDTRIEAIKEEQGIITGYHNQ